MRFRAILPVILCLTLSAWAGKTVVPTTTLAAETGNNTSGADSFTTQANGNIAPKNVSRMPVRDLLYAGASTKIYAHFMGWFGGTNHMNVGYRSDDAAQVKKQVSDMMARGIDGAIIDWYGPNSARANDTTTLLMREAEGSSGQFSFAVMEDVGALKACAATIGCDVTQTLINDLNYANATYQASPAYMRLNGRPLVFFFGVEAYAIDWNRVRAGVLGDPIFVQRNAGAFTALQMNGGYGWVAPETVNATDPLGLLYVDNFYTKSLLYPGQLALGGAYAGFNDTLAAWTKNRSISQQCGQTWLTLMERAGKYYSAAKQLPFMQLVTWNDYEEGTELETGIENCVSVSAAMSGTTLNWSITGAENTLDHFTVFISSDGQNLMPLADMPTGSRSLEIGSYGFDPGNYTLYVKAVAKAMITNKMSNGAAFTVQVQRVINIATPFDGATVTSPVRIAATGTSGYPVVAMQIYVDGVKVYQTSNASLDTSLTMQSGSRYVVVKGWDSTGGNWTKAITLNVLANKSPVAMLSVTPLQGTSPVTVTASAAGSYDPDGSIAAMMIDFGDGYVATTANASHIYPAAGTYTITATVTDNAGAVSRTSQTVTVAAPMNYVTIHTPGDGGSVSLKPRITATGYSNVGVYAMQIYVDGKLLFKTLGSRIDTVINVGRGAHTLEVKGWDTIGKSFSSTVDFTAN